MKTYIVFIVFCLFSFNSFSQFITTWDVGSNFEINIPTFPGETYNYSVDWENDGVIDDTNITGDISHIYASGTTEVTVSITGTFPRIFIDNSIPERFEILSVDQWGNNPWTSMGSAFRGCSNMQILATDEPDLSAVTDCSLMFRSAHDVNGGLENWNVSNVEDFSFMFQSNQNFNGDISGWDTGSAIDMTQMFDKAFDFVQDISSWDVADVTSMFGMFFQCPIDQNLGDWNISSAPDMTSMFFFASISIENYDLTLKGWESQNIAGITLGASGAKYCNSKFERDELVANGWTITGDSESCGTNDFVTTWNTTNVGPSDDNQITIPASILATYSYDVDWDNDGTYDEYGITGSATHTFPTSGLQTIRIKGEFPRIYFAGSNDRLKLISIDQWGSMDWSHMTDAFMGCDNMNITATDAPDLSNVANMSSMLRACDNLTASIDHWDVSNVSNFNFCFAYSDNFNSPLSSWNVSNALFMREIFNSATSFNQNISNWDVSGVLDFASTFENATSMNQNLSGWDITSALTLTNMLSNSGFSVENYDEMLIAWNSNNPPSGLNFGATGLQWCNGDDARDELINNSGWTINGDSRYCLGDIATDPLELTVNRECNYINYSFIGFVDSGYTPAPTCGSGITDDMWFVVNVPSSSLLILDFNNTDDYIVSIYSGSSNGPLIDCYEITNGDNIKLEEDQISSGEDLYIQVYRTTAENDFEICAYDPQLNCTSAIIPMEEQFVTPILLQWDFTDIIAADSYNVYLGGNEPLGFIGNSTSLQIDIPLDSTKDERLMYWRAVPVRDGVESNNCTNSVYYNTAASSGTMVCSRAVYLKLDHETCNYNIVPSDVTNQGEILHITGLPDAAVLGNGTANVTIDGTAIPEVFSNPIIIDSYLTPTAVGRGCITEGYLSKSANCGEFGFDNDGDGIPFNEDNCPEISNVNQLDTDSDNIGDVCDNCISNANPSQSDYDENGIGDVCDTVGNLQTDNNVGVGIADPNFKLEVDGSLFINADPSSGALILKSADGSCWRMIATDNGNLNLVKTDCGS